ncbi:MAG TPA: Xaa-Pro peptidase family protein [Conexibacter sp.]|nr:Xaa-Pro peptidase family protein [Conexibacter sp.]
MSTPDRAAPAVVLSAGERARRLAALREALEQEGFDALVAYALPDYPGYVIYLTGYEPIYCDAWCVVTAERVSLVTPTFEFAHTGGSSWLDPADVHRTNEPVAAIERLLGGARHVAFAGIDFLPTPLGGQLGLLDPASRFAAADVLERVRWSKSDEEIALIRDASRIIDAGTVAFTEGVRRGAGTEVELTAEIYAAMHRAGLERVWSEVVLGGGPRAADMTTQPRNVPLVAGELVLFDNAERHNGYCADVARAAVVGGGDPGPEQLRMLETARAMYDAQHAMLRPGADARAVHELGAEIAADAGYVYEHLTGHGIGTDLHELPAIGRAEVELTAGMVVAIEPGLYVPGVGGVRLENVIAITDDGPVDLTVAPTVLW